jgi:hypothetical protein
VGSHHKDFDSVTFGYGIELKSQFSDTFYKKNGYLKKTFNIRFNNSMGTNNNDVMPDEHICDYLIIMRQDGVCVVDKKVIKEKLVKTGDGFNLKLDANDLIEITGRLNIIPRRGLGMKQKIVDLVKGTI